MAYASVAQGEHDITDLDSRTLDTPSPILPDLSRRPLSLGFERVPEDAVGGQDEVPPAEDVHADGGSFLKSWDASQPYQMVEDDDYEVQEPDQPRILNNVPVASSVVEHAAMSTEPQLVRTASISRNLPLNHPTPDLRSLHGAYRKNVERLEETAERLSFTSSLEEEMQKMKMDHRRPQRQSDPSESILPRRQASNTSLSNSIIGLNSAARFGGYSPSGYITSPTGSIRSGAWSHQQHMDRASTRASRLGPPFPLSEEEEMHNYGNLKYSPPDREFSEPHKSLGSPTAANGHDPLDRPSTSASNDTYRQASRLFNDFDGVHYSASARLSLDQSDRHSRRISLAQPPLARDSKAYKEPQPGEKMIYYPAPVPVMLNLPQRLSKMDFDHRDKRRLQALSGIPTDMRKSAAWLGQEDNLSASDKRTINLPPQLRASAFFDQASQAPNVELKNGSAVATLDSILDAAAFAPVSAFTDHPIAGQLGKEVYGSTAPRKSTQLQVGNKKKKKEKRRSSLSNILKSKGSRATLSDARPTRITSRESKALEQEDALSGDELDRAAAESMAPGADEVVDGEQEADSEDEEDRDESEYEDSDEEHLPGFLGAPTTLLAELQLRKEQQKQRNRTAADAFPDGMHSTLLELDAVTQLQQKSRKQKHVTLAWEDHDAADRQNFDDDEVPLAVLFPEKERPSHVNINRPMGLMEKRELEDNEPLSFRQARLRGHPQPVSQAPGSVRQEPDKEAGLSKSNVQLPGLLETNLDEAEEETLAQRIKRIKEEKTKSVGGDFAKEVSSELGLKTDADEPGPFKTPEAEETLGQRRKRLQQEALDNPQSANTESADNDSRPQFKPRYSLADILQAHPVGAPRQVSNESQKAKVGNLPRVNPLGTSNLFNQQSTTSLNTPNMYPYQQHFVYGNGAFNGANNFMYGAGQNMMMPIGANGFHYGYGAGIQPGYIQDPSMGPPLDAKQRAVIDRWRQGIV